MKKFILSGLTALLFLLIVTSSCSEKDNRSYAHYVLLSTRMVEKIYVISPKTMRIYSIYEIYEAPGCGSGSIRSNEVRLETLKTEDVYNLYTSELIKPGLTFQPANNGEVLPAFFHEKDSLIRPMERFYLKVDNAIIDFRILGAELYEKQLSRVEIDNLSAEIKERMSLTGGTFAEFTK